MDLVTVAASEPLLVELLNSPRVGVDRTDIFTDEGAAADWVRAHGGAGTPAEIADARAFRNALASYLTGHASAAVLDGWTARVRRVPRIEGGELTWETLAPAEAAISVRALLEWAALQSRGGSRLRCCANTGCGLFFIDRSKANARKWCDMAVCGNRTKARRYHERTIRAQEAAAARRQPATDRVTTGGTTPGGATTGGATTGAPASPPGRPAYRGGSPRPTRIALPNARTPQAPPSR